MTLAVICFIVNKMIPTKEEVGSYILSIDEAYDPTTKTKYTLVSGKVPLAIECAPLLETKGGIQEDETVLLTTKREVDQQKTDAWMYGYYSGICTFAWFVGVITYLYVAVPDATLTVKDWLCELPQ